MASLKTIFHFGCLAVAFAVSGTGAVAGEILRMGGTGAATALLPQLFAAFDRTEQVTLQVIPGLGSGGALLAISDGALDVAVSGRPLSKEEIAKGLTQPVAFRTPFAFVTSHPKPNGLKSTEIATVFGATKATWADGTPIRTILRPKSDADIPLLAGFFPGIDAAIDRARSRTEVPVAATDQDNARLAEQIPGSLAGATVSQIKTEKRDLRLVAIDGVEPTLANYERGAYPYGKTIHFVLSGKKNPTAERFIAFLRSPAGIAALRDTGSLPSTD
jgi:phosphate transport system substrate-binding protein